MILFVISTLALLIISVTMFVRANDLGWRPEWKWRVRLFGFILAGCAPIGIVVMEPTPSTIAECLFRVGLMFVFVTTPNMPPWWRWISGYDKN